MIRKGTRVRLVKHAGDSANGVALYEAGVVHADMVEGSNSIPVRWDTYNKRRHGFEGEAFPSCTNGHGWWVARSNIQVFAAEKQEAVGMRGIIANEKPTYRNWKRHYGVI